MSKPLQALWQTTLETAVESGQTPLLDLGLSSGVLPSLPSSLALMTFAQERLDMTTPDVVIGGDASSWLAVLLATPPPDQPVAPLAITYGGTDQATQIASVNLEQSRSLPPQSAAGELPSGLVAWFVPAQHVGSTAWVAWPFLFWTTRTTALRTAGDRWLNWAGLGLAVGLIIGALLI